MPTNTKALQVAEPAGIVAGKNAIINGGFDIWQRGTSTALVAVITGGYVSDRWQGYRAVAGSTCSRQVTNDTTNLPFIQYCARIQRDSGNTSTSNIAICQSVESLNAIPFAGKTVTVSFYARAGANYSAASSVMRVRLLSSTTTDQNILFNGGSSVIDQNATLTTTWQRFTYTGTIGATAVSFGTIFDFTPVGTAGANDYFEITGVQLELGNTATPFSRAGGNIQGELAACQRYYFRNNAVDAYACFGWGTASSTTQTIIYVPTPVTLRVTPSAIEYSNLQVGDAVTGTSVTSATLSGNQKSIQIVQINASVASGLTQYRPYALQSANSASGYLGFSAEL